MEETIGFRRSVHLPGVEILDADHTTREWRWFNTAYAVAVCRSWTWHCDVVYRRRRREMERGMAFCSEPGEVHTTTPGVRGGGSFSALFVEPVIFSEYVAEYRGTHDLPHWSAINARPSRHLERRLSTLMRAVGEDRAALQLQSAFADLIESLLNEFVESVRGAPRRSAPTRGAAERIRECLHADYTCKSDLASLARETGLSRFQVLREFKQRYGLPPYAYQLSTRVAHARALLRRDVSPAEVAAACGFADQSHFTRHFRRMVGTTPLRYARASSRPTSDREVGDRAIVDVGLSLP